MICNKSHNPLMMCNSFGKSSIWWLKAPVIMVKSMYKNEKKEVNLSKNKSKSQYPSAESSRVSKWCNSAMPIIKAIMPTKLIIVLEIFDTYSASSRIVSRPEKEKLELFQVFLDDLKILPSKPKNKTKLMMAAPMIINPAIVPLNVCVKSLFRIWRMGCGLCTRLTSLSSFGLK